MRHRLFLLLLLIPSVAGGAEPPRASNEAILARRSVQVHPNLTYREVGPWAGKLDLYLVAGKGPRPLIVNFHGGGWTENVKERSQPALLPFLQTGWAVANVGYRLAATAPAPAAVEDARCAMSWLADHAQTYGLDPTRFVLMGDSAGAHLALMAGMLPANSEFDRTCASKALFRVAAIVNYYGISDVAEVVAGKSQRTWAVEWLGRRKDTMALATKLTPLAYVRANVPAIISVHGDSDPVVPFSQSVRLHAALKKAGVINRLITVKGGGHDYGGLSAAETVRAHRSVEEFLIGLNVWPR